MFYEISGNAGFLIFIAGLILGGAVGALLGYLIYHTNVENMKKRLALREMERKNSSIRYSEDTKKPKTTSKKETIKKEPTTTDRDAFYNNRENELNKKEELLDDREMALAEGLDEIIDLKQKVDAIINAQKEELFSYCSVSEESALKMKEVTLEVQKKLQETIEKIQE